MVEAKIDYTKYIIGELAESDTYHGYTVGSVREYDSKGAANIAERRKGIEANLKYLYEETGVLYAYENGTLVIKDDSKIKDDWKRALELQAKAYESENPEISAGLRNGDLNPLISAHTVAFEWPESATDEQIDIAAMDITAFEMATRANQMIEKLNAYEREISQAQTSRATEEAQAYYAVTTYKEGDKDIQVGVETLAEQLASKVTGIIVTEEELKPFRRAQEQAKADNKKAIDTIKNADNFKVICEYQADAVGRETALGQAWLKTAKTKRLDWLQPSEANDKKAIKDISALRAAAANWTGKPEENPYRSALENVYSTYRRQVLTVAKDNFDAVQEEQSQTFAKATLEAQAYYADKKYTGKDGKPVQVGVDTFALALADKTVKPFDYKKFKEFKVMQETGQKENADAISTLTADKTRFAMMCQYQANAVGRDTALGKAWLETAETQNIDWLIPSQSEGLKKLQAGAKKANDGLKVEENQLALNNIYSAYRRQVLTVAKEELAAHELAEKERAAAEAQKAAEAAQKAAEAEANAQKALQELEARLKDKKYDVTITKTVETQRQVRTYSDTEYKRAENVLKQGVFGQSGHGERNRRYKDKVPDEAAYTARIAEMQARISGLETVEGGLPSKGKDDSNAAMYLYKLHQMQTLTQDDTDIYTRTANPKNPKKKGLKRRVQLSQHFANKDCFTPKQLEEWVTTGKIDGKELAPEEQTKLVKSFQEVEKSIDGFGRVVLDVKGTTRNRMSYVRGGGDAKLPDITTVTDTKTVQETVQMSEAEIKESGDTAHLTEQALAEKTANEKALADAKAALQKAKDEKAAAEEKAQKAKIAAEKAAKVVEEQNPLKEETPKKEEKPAEKEEEKPKENTLAQHAQSVSEGTESAFLPKGKDKSTGLA